MMAGSIGEIRVRRDRLGTSRWAASTEENDGSTARWEGWRAGDGEVTSSSESSDTESGEGEGDASFGHRQAQYQRR
jgi:hypothetical protein